jgi:tetratricopeptide (TPR) repeat protein
LWLAAPAWLGCVDVQPDAAAAEPDACRWMRAPAAGPMAAAVAAEVEPLRIAELRIAEARLTGDPGFYTLADTAVACALARDPSDAVAIRQRANLLNQFHRFAEAEALIAPIAAASGAADDWIVLSDARLDRGDLPGAIEALDRALAAETSLRTLDRAAWLVWQRGELERAIELERRAVRLGVPGDHEAIAWALTRLGWYLALAGRPTDALDAALVEVPGYRPALVARGRLRLFAGDRDGAAADLRAAGETVAARTALSEIDPTVDVRAVGRQDARGFAVWLADHGDPATALKLLQGELTQRQDAITQAAWAWAVHKAGGDGRQVAAEALATGVGDPEARARAGIVAGDAEAVRGALARGPGVPPSLRAEAEAWLASR